MNNSPLVSIMMNCYNGEKYLRDAIDSVYKQTYDNWEIILFDNASVDNTEDIAKSYNKKLKYYRNSKTVDLGIARNMALDKCSGEYVAILDCDDIWLREKLEKQINIFISKPETAVVYSYCGLISGDGEFINNAKRKLFRGKIFRHMLQNNFIPPSPTVVIKKELIYLMGGFSNYKAAIDYDLLLKLGFNYEFEFVDEILALYRVHANALSNDHENIYLECCKILEELKKNPECQNKFFSKLIDRSIARTYYIIGVYELSKLNNTNKARINFIKSLKVAPSIKSIIFLSLSYLKPSFVVKMLLYIRKHTGRGILTS